MKLREYGVITTGVLGAVFSFDIIWNMTSMEAFDAMFTAMIIGIFLSIWFVFLTEPRERSEKRTKPTFQTDEATGLSVMIQGRRGA